MSPSRDHKADTAEEVSRKVASTSSLRPKGAKLPFLQKVEGEGSSMITWPDFLAHKIPIHSQHSLLSSSLPHEETRPIFEYVKILLELERVVVWVSRHLCTWSLVLQLVLHDYVSRKPKAVVTQQFEGTFYSLCKRKDLEWLNPTN